MASSEVEQGGTDVVIPGHGGEPKPMRTLFYEQNGERETHIVCSPDGMRAYLKLIPGAEFGGVSREEIVGLIYGAGVTHGVIEAGLSLFAGLQNGAAPFRGYFQVARGDAMRRGEDGSIEFHVQPTAMQPRYDETDTGNIDYKHLNLIENCFAGQRVASILPPGPGRAGLDIFGREIRPEPGKPAEVRPGAGVMVSPNGRDFTSEIEGRLVFEDGVLSVSPSLEILHDIDYNIGNVDFVGKVVVKGSLLDGFYVNGKRGVEIHGDVGAARISSEGDVLITGGVKGKSAAIITCRSLTAHYIDEATVEATGDVAATKEILNSDVKALGRVTLSTGTAIGGVVCGFQGLELGSAGSEMGVGTWLVSGLNWTEENKKEEIRAQVAEYLERVHSAKSLLDPLFEDQEVTSRLNSEEKSMLSELIAELREVRENLLELLQQRASIAGRRQKGMVNQININNKVYMGVSVRFSEVDGEVKDTVTGPLSITQDVESGTVRFDSQARLPPRRDESEDVERAEQGEGVEQA